MHCCDDQSHLHIILRSWNIHVWNFIYSLVFFTLYGYIIRAREEANCQLAWWLSSVERCTGIARDKASNAVQAWIFFQALNHNWDDQSYRHIILRSSSIWTFKYSLAECSSPSTGIYELTKRPTPSCLDSLAGKTLHRYRRSHAFEFRWGLNSVYQALISQLWLWWSIISSYFHSMVNLKK